MAEQIVEERLAIPAVGTRWTHVHKGGAYRVVCVGMVEFHDGIWRDAVTYRRETPADDGKEFFTRTLRRFSERLLPLAEPAPSWERLDDGSFLMERPADGVALWLTRDGDDWEAQLDDITFDGGCCERKQRFRSRNEAEAALEAWIVERKAGKTPVAVDRRNMPLPAAEGGAA